jgi:hypothetical protein
MPFGRRVSTIEDTDDLLTERQVIEFVATTDKCLPKMKRVTASISMGPT